LGRSGSGLKSVIMFFSYFPATLPPYRITHGALQVNYQFV
jgi:hypothetical protein